jgi:hypothetical protein
VTHIQVSDIHGQPEAAGELDLYHPLIIKRYKSRRSHRPEIELTVNMYCPSGWVLGHPGGHSAKVNVSRVQTATVARGTGEEMKVIHIHIQLECEGESYSPYWSG